MIEQRQMKRGQAWRQSVVAWLSAFRERPWWPITTSVIGLLVAIAIAGLVGLTINARVKGLTDRALQYDVELEDRGNELRLAVLELRHIHRNILFAGRLSRNSVADFEAAYIELLSQIDRLDQLGMPDPRLPQPDRLRSLVRAYYADFRPAIELRDNDPEAFLAASDEGLVQLDTIGLLAAEIGRAGEERSQAALRVLERTTVSAQRVQLAVLAGLVLVGAGLSYTTVRMVREQQETSEKLAHALKAKTDFIADASHELRTPLTVLRGNAEVALELDRTCVHTELLEEIVEESERMTKLVEELLFLARSDAGSLPLNAESIELQPFLVELSERATILARERGATLQLNIDAEGQFTFDAARISQVVMILVDNAAKYSPAGTPILLTSTSSDGNLVIEVTDRGPGIPRDDLPMVFERFYRVDKARARAQGGAGLGLAIARTIVEAHGGRIMAESELNRGTTMRFFLPHKGPAELEKQAHAPATAGGA
jgi:two-component system, OmpR family, sensor histidine kinase VicK